VLVDTVVMTSDGKNERFQVSYDKRSGDTLLIDTKDNPPKILLTAFGVSDCGIVRSDIYDLCVLLNFLWGEIKLCKGDLT